MYKHIYMYTHIYIHTESLCMCIFFTAIIPEKNGMELFGA